MPRVIGITVKTELCSLGCQMSSFDSSSFYWKKGTNLEGIICVHVDDFWTPGTDLFFRLVVDKLATVFTIGSRKKLPYRYLKLDISRTDEGIKLSIGDYVYNKSLVDAVKSTKSVQDKRLRVDMSHLKHLVNEQKELQLNWIASSKQLADCLTKTTSANYGNLERIIGVVQAPSFVTPEPFD